MSYSYYGDGDIVTETMPWEGAGRKIWEEQLMQDHPDFLIIDNTQPSHCGALTQYSPGLEEATNFTPAQIVIKPDRIATNKELSYDTIRTISAVDRAYTPDAGEKPFIEGSGKQIPNVFCKSEMKAAAECVSLMRAAGKDTSIFKQNFNRMWGIDEDFDIEDYAPTVNPKRSKPWLKWDSKHNYEVWYGIEAQAMIHTTCGSYEHSGKRYNASIDWDLVRLYLRLIATNVFLTEPGVLDKVISENKEITLRFMINHANFPPMREPTWQWNRYLGDPFINLSAEDNRSLMLDRPRSNMHRNVTKTAILNMLPAHIIDEIRSEKLVPMGNLSLTYALENLQYTDLESKDDEYRINIPITSTIRLEGLLSLYNVIRAVLKSWMVGINMRDIWLHKMKAAYEVDEEMICARLISDNLPNGLLEYALKVYISNNVRAKVAMKEYYDVIFGNSPVIPAFSYEHPSSAVHSACNSRITNYIHVFNAAYDLAISERQLITIQDFIPNEVITQDIELTQDTIKEIAYKNISKFYCRKYLGRIIILKEHIQTIRDHALISSIKDKITLMQQRTSMIPLMSFLNKETPLYDSIFTSVGNFVRKRMRTKSKWEQITNINRKSTVRHYCEQVDKVLQTSFTKHYDDSYYKSQQIKEDINRLGWNGQHEYTLPFATRYKKMISLYKKEKLKNVIKILTNEEKKALLGIAYDQGMDAQAQLYYGVRPWDKITQKKKESYIHKITGKCIAKIENTKNTSMVPKSNETSRSYTDDDTIISTMDFKDEITESNIAPEEEYDMDGFFDEDSDEDKNPIVSQLITFDEWFTNKGMPGTAYDARVWLNENTEMSFDFTDQPHKLAYWNEQLPQYEDQLRANMRRLIQQDYEEEERAKTDFDKGSDLM